MKLFNRNFNLVVIGQIISLFGNAMLRFALPLYLLDQTGSSAAFGAVMAFSFVPIVLMSPIGGLLADRVNKRNIMVILDFGTAFLTLVFLFSIGKVSTVPLVAVVMIILSGIQSVYQPSVQASMPLLQDQENLMSANAIINQVNSLANLLGPILGGVVYGVWGVTPVVAAGGICFFFSAVMEIFIRIPYQKRQLKGGMLHTVKSDFSESIAFIKKERPVIKKAIFIVAGFNLVLSSMIIIGVPVLIRTHLGLSSQLLGYAQGAQAAGALLGGILAGVLGKRLRIQKAWLSLAGTAAAIFPLGIGLAIGAGTMAVYVLIIVAGMLSMMCATIFTVQVMVFVQGETPGTMVGKVISLTIAASSCSQPVGQAIYGVLFEKLADVPQWIVLTGAVLSSLIALASKRVFDAFKGMDQEK